MSAMAQVLHGAGCLSEPPPPPPPVMTLDEAAELLCRRAQTPRLDPNDPDDVASVVSSRAQFEYAWASGVRAGAKAEDIDLHVARRVLAKHHGLI